MEPWQLKQMQSLDLEVKILKTKQRIKEWYEKYDGKVYVSFSGGKDSTVLVDIVRETYPDIPVVFVNTGLEYPNILQFVKSISNVTMLRPAMSFKQVVEKYGYPVVSKIQAFTIRKLTTQNLSDRYRNKLMNGDERGSTGKLSEKWKMLLNAPFKVSEQCCNVLKKNPVKKYEKETGNHPITGMMACESKAREQAYLKTGCNAFDLKRPQSQPLGFWTEQDILLYFKIRNTAYCDIYGDIVAGGDGLLVTTGEKRTGCMFCMFGVHLEKGENRFQRMERTHPKLHEYCITKLGLGAVLEFIGVEYGKREIDYLLD